LCPILLTPISGVAGPDIGILILVPIILNPISGMQCTISVT
jgi:hypothetical protein